MRVLISRLPVGLTAMALLVAGGCGDEAPKDDEGKVREAMQQFADSEPELCGKLTNRFFERTFEGTRADCERDVAEIEKVELEVDSVEIEGRRANVTATIGSDAVRALLVKTGDTWKLDRVQAAPAE